MLYNLLTVGALQLFGNKNHTRRLRIRPYESAMTTKRPTLMLLRGTNTYFSINEDIILIV